MRENILIYGIVLVLIGTSLIPGISGRSFDFKNENDNNKFEIDKEEFNFNMINYSSNFIDGKIQNGNKLYNQNQEKDVEVFSNGYIYLHCRATLQPFTDIK